MIYIVVPTYNRVEICKHFISDLRKQSFQDFHLVLVDHGKIKTGIEGEKIARIESDVNGWARAVNVGLRFVLEKASEKDSVLIINDDVILTEDYLWNINESVREKPGAILGTCCIDQNTKKNLRVAIRLNRIKAKHIYLYQKRTEDELPNGYIESDVLTGKGTVIPIEVLKKVGIYAEEKLPHYKADHELIWRAKKAGVLVYASTRMRLYTLSDQKKASGNDPLWQTLKFMFTDMRSILRVRDWWCYANLAYSKPYALYFFAVNFLRNTIFMMVDYIRTR